MTLLIPDPPPVRYVVTPEGRPPFVAQVPEDVAPAIEALRRATEPLAPVAQVRALRAYGLPVVKDGAGHRLAGRVEKIVTPPLRTPPDPDECEF